MRLLAGTCILALSAALVAAPASQPASGPTSCPIEGNQLAALQRQVEDLRDQVDQLRRENAALRAQIMRLRSDKPAEPATTQAATPRTVLLADVANMSPTELRRLSGTELSGDGQVDRIDVGVPDADRCIIHIEQAFSRSKHRRVRCELIVPATSAGKFKGGTKGVDFTGKIISATIATQDPNPDSPFAYVSRKPLVLRVDEVKAFVREVRYTSEPGSRVRSIDPAMPPLDGFLVPR